MGLEGLHSSFSLAFPPRVTQAGRFCGLGLLFPIVKLSPRIPVDLAGVQGFCDHRAAESETWKEPAVPFVGGAESPSFTFCLGKVSF